MSRERFHETPVWHELKIWPDYFYKVLVGWKTCEIRINDRDFREMDYLVLREYDPDEKVYTGRVVTRQVTNIVQGEFGLPEDVCVMSLSK